MDGLLKKALVAEVKRLAYIVIDGQEAITTRLNENLWRVVDGFIDNLHLVEDPTFEGVCSALTNFIAAIVFASSGLNDLGISISFMPAFRDITKRANVNVMYAPYPN